MYGMGWDGRLFGALGVLVVGFGVLTDIGDLYFICQA